MAFEPFNSVGGYTIGIPPIPVINENGVATLNGLQVTGLSNLGSVGNVIILGGNNGYFLQTDGEGRLTWAPGGNGGGGNGIPGGANTQVQYNNAGNFGGDAGFTYNSLTNVLSVSGNIVANRFIGNGALLTGIVAPIANFANFAGNVTVSNQPNITSVGTLTSLSVTGNVSANYFLGNGAFLTGVGNANFTPIANFANFAGNVTVSNQPNITGLGTLTNVSVSGNANVGNLKANLIASNLIPATSNIYTLGNTTNRWKDVYLAGNSIYLGNVTLADANGSLSINGGTGNIVANNLSNVPAANVIGQVANSLVASTVYTNAQPNITGVGTLTSLSVTGNATAGNLVTAGAVTGANITANQFLSALNANITGTTNLSGPVIITNTGTLTSLGNINFTSAPNVTLGTISNLHISGGVAGYFLRTDGAGNLSWTAGGGGGNGTPGGNTTEVQFNENGTFGASANFVFNPFNYTIIVDNINTKVTNANTSLVSNLSANLKTNTTISGNLTLPANVNATASANINLGSVTNVHIEGGVNGYVLQTDGAGNLSWTAGGGGGNGVPGGSNTQIQYNDTGVFGGSAFLTFNENTNTFQVAGNLIANTTQIGAGVYKFSTNSVYAATTSSTASNQLLWSTLASNVAGVDFHIIATDLGSGTRQISKISSVILGNIVQWNEYGSLLINGGVGSFDVAYRPGNVVSESLVELRVTPDSTNITSYKIMITEYTP
jgi:hypothetical protein